MGEKICVDIVEQNAVFNGKPEFSLPLAAAINLLNFHGFGGTPKDMQKAIEDPCVSDPRLYRVTLRLDYEEL
jgi:hypothetical protein